ncbi:hypothetical protein CBR_g50365 [Chara braunii]|uniref:Uncharacterized protein n=1 Tax=Chara braunii TaxID=69332 RepID=A0A388K5N7_CHABU|nr:hypothetical protein CBR_g50365 [Chara braunii]|eukprot:GBG65329.1 hypothetical protein CBR_g50365 [Chara braunii]
MMGAVSYTHLDVYKRQAKRSTTGGEASGGEAQKTAGQVLVLSSHSSETRTREEDDGDGGAHGEIGNDGAAGDGGHELADAFNAERGCRCTESQDLVVITMKYCAFSATTDQGVSGMRKSCQLNIAMASPGYSFSLEMVTLRGYTFLDDKVNATHKVSFYLTGELGTGSFSGSTTGPFDDNYQHSGPVNPKSQVPRFGGLARSGRRNLNVRAEVRVDNSANRSGVGFIDVDRYQGRRPRVQAEVEWTTCK